jgi:hypothetical protein
MSIIEDLKVLSLENLTSENQHGFRSGHSTTTTALSIQGRITKAFPWKKICFSHHSWPDRSL